MAETLGTLCDKLTIVKLKQYHTVDGDRLKSLDSQAKSLEQEIDEYLQAVISGRIPAEKLSFASNKVYKESGNETEKVSGDIGQIFYRLADVNCRLWHEQEKVYEFETVAPENKDIVVKQLALLNLERNDCIDRINLQLVEMIRLK